MNTFTFLEKAARFQGGEPAIIFGDEVTSYAEFQSNALAMAGKFSALGLARGDRVAFCH
jgi:acyl-CoA synthetase (AMP-forming)/AMP-acid ligase II